MRVSLCICHTGTVRIVLILRYVTERRKRILKINEFLTEDLDLFREQCNFSSNESSVFELKARGWTDVQIALELNMSESNVQVVMRKIRNKIDEVLRRNVRHLNQESVSSCSRCIVGHAMSEWAKIPDFLSAKNVIYIYSDYRTEGEINIPRIKIGDGVHSLSEIPFCTMSITDDDMAYWDDKPDTTNNNFGKIVEIHSPEVFVFPTDGYVMLEFNDAKDFAKVKIFGASGQSYFEFEKQSGVDVRSKEVFVKCGMKCEFVSKSKDAKIKFVPLV